MRDDPFAQERTEVIASRDVHDGAYAESPEVASFRAYAEGRAVPPRLRAWGMVAGVGYLALHAAIEAAVVIPHVDGWTVFAVFSFLAPVPLSFAFARFARAVIDPSVGFYDRGDEENGRPPGVRFHTRGAGLAACAALLAVLAGWSAWAVPSLQHASGGSRCARCHAR